MSDISDLFGIGSSIAGFLGNQSKNTQAKDQYNKQTSIANQQLSLAQLIQQAAQAEQSKGTNVIDPYGGGTVYDPATGTWKTTLGGAQALNQGASDAEQNARLSGDQAVRRNALYQADELRQNAAGEADSARRSYDNLQQGIGTVDPSSIASSLRLARTGAVNAGYDEAMKAAGMASLRTGTSAGDVYANLAKQRANSIAQTMGDPTTEGLTTAESINQGRKSQALQSYNLFNNAGSNFNDSAFTPVNYASTATDNAYKSLGADLDKYSATTQGMGTAAATIGSAGNGLRQADNAQMQNTNYANTAQLISSLGKTLGSSNSGGLASVLSKLGLGG